MTQLSKKTGEVGSSLRQAVSKLQVRDAFEEEESWSQLQAWSGSSWVYAAQTKRLELLIPCLSGHLFSLNCCCFFLQAFNFFPHFPDFNQFCIVSFFALVQVTFRETNAFFTAFPLLSCIYKEDTAFLLGSISILPAKSWIPRLERRKIVFLRSDGFDLWWGGSIWFQS